MIEVKQAVANAVGFLRAIYDEEGLSDIRLEEVELSEDEGVWQITLSFHRARGESTSSDLAAALGLSTKREFKTLAVSSSTGNVQSMKIRTFS